MSTTATAIAREMNRTGVNPLAQAPVEKPLKTLNRYVWTPAEDIPNEEMTLGYVTTLRQMAKRLGMNIPISGNYVERCRVAPVLAAVKWDRWVEVPAELRTGGREPDGMGNYHEASYKIEPGDIFDEFMAQYRMWGCVELMALRGLPIEDFIALQADETFFPEEKDRSKTALDGNPLDTVPRAYSTLRARIVTIAENLPHDGRGQLLRAVAADMLTAISMAEAFDTQLVDTEETAVPLKYSKRGLRALDRLERQRRDHAMNEMAKLQRAAFEKQVSDSNAPAPAVGVSPSDLETILNRVEEKAAERLEAVVERLTAPALTAPTAKPNASNKPTAPQSR